MGGLNKFSKRVCEKCGELKQLRWRAKQRFCSPECFQRWQIGSNNAFYKGLKTFTCAQCDLAFSDYPYRSRSKEQFCSQKCAKIKMGKNRLLDNHPNWKGGRNKTKKGYIKIHTSGHPEADRFGLMFEHRLVMEKHLGRYLTKIEVVHHINGNKSDNRIENLMLFPNNQAHMKYETTN